MQNVLKQMCILTGLMQFANSMICPQLTVHISEASFVYDEVL